MIEMQRYYRHMEKCSAIEGDVLEVGLGWAFSAGYIMNSPKCKSLDSYEVNPQAIADFKAKGKQDNRHKVIEHDFKTHANAKKYDFMYIDILSEGSTEETDSVIAMCEKGKGMLKDRGKITVQFWADSAEERRLRTYLNDNFISKIEVLGRHYAMPRIMYWTPK